MRVLIFDDSQMVWKRLFDMLGGFPHVSTLAYAGSICWGRRCLAAFQPHLLVLDISLPDGNGLELLKEVHAAESRIKVAVFSNQRELAQHSLKQGADWFFDKSLEFPQLLELLLDRSFWLEQGAIERSHRSVAS